MRISKATAENITFQLLQKRKGEIEALEKEISTQVTQYYESLIPKAVIAFTKKYKGYIPETGYIFINNGFFKHERFSLTKQLPKIEGSSILLDIAPEFNKKLQALCNKKVEMQKDLRELKDETVGTLLALGTTKRITDVFPEAARLLPAENCGMTKALALNIESLRKRIA